MQSFSVSGIRSKQQAVDKQNGLSEELSTKIHEFELKARNFPVSGYGFRWETFIRSLLSLGVVHPDATDRPESLTPAAQRHFNKRVHKILQDNFALDQLRRQLRKDMLREDNPSPTYSQELLDGYLRTKPSDWI